MFTLLPIWNNLEKKLKEKCHTVVIFRTSKRETTVSLRLFYLELKPENNNKTIYNIKSLSSCTVQFEAPHQKSQIPQYANCQQYGHTKEFCRGSARCLKCSGNHSALNCPGRKKQWEFYCN